MDFNKTPSANRLHIAFFGKQNSGKSTLLNAVTNQDISIVSEHKGATADPVYKTMEIAPLGPCVLIDTAGFDDSGDLGALRVEKTKAVLDKTDIAILLIADDDLHYEKLWVEKMRAKNITVIFVVNDFGNEKTAGLVKLCKKIFSSDAIVMNAKKRTGREKLIQKLAKNIPEKFENLSITAGHVKEDDVVMLVMPQDTGAPKGRLILPQVQTTRDLLDNKCIVISVTHDKMEKALSNLKNPPKLVIADSQVFPYVYERLPKGSKLTSFSVLFAAYKGDLHVLLQGIKNFEDLPQDIPLNVLVAEACTHAPQTEDIGRVKIPNILREKYGQRVHIQIVSGNDFPKDLNNYHLVIHCGGCMINKTLMMNRLEKLQKQNISVTNYGIFLAYATGILDKIDMPCE